MKTKQEIQTLLDALRGSEDVNVQELVWHYEDQLREMETLSVRNIQQHISRGNRKVPFYIFNMTTASECPAEKAGLCKVARICYAKRSERLYKQVKPYRQRQNEIWKHVTAVQFVDALVEMHSRSRTMKKILRFSEAGDFATQADVDKMAAIADLLNAHGWTVYGYTARVDLDLKGLIQHARVNLSVEASEYYSQGANRFMVVDAPTKINYVCPGDCSTCDACYTRSYSTIEVVKH